MEDATISKTEEQEATPTVQGVRSLVTEDDLQLEIGRWVVASLNKDKMLMNAGRQMMASTQKMQAQEAEIIRLQPHEASCNLLSEKNDKLADSLRDVKAELETANKENSRLTAKDEAHIDQIDMLEKRVICLKKDIKETLDSSDSLMADRDGEIVKLKARIKKLSPKKKA